MADLLKMDPARIARLRDPARLAQANPERVLDVVSTPGAGTLVDVGAGVGYVTLPLARRFRDVTVVACDVLEGMLDLLALAAREEGLGNVDTALMPDAVTLPLATDSAALLMMLQVHHELDDPPGLLADCARVLRPGAPIVIVDWKDEALPGMPQGGRRVAASVIREHLTGAGFVDVVAHDDLYPLHSTSVGIAPPAR